MKSIFKTLSIKYKIIFISLITGILSSGLGLAIISFTQISAYKSELKNQSVVDARLIAEYCTAPLSFNQKNGVDDILGKLTKLPQIAVVQIYDNQDELFASYCTENQGVDNDITLKKTQFAAYQDDGFLHVFEPIVRKHKSLGTVYLKISTEKLDAKIHSYFLALLIAIAVILLVGYFLSLYLQQHISKPILNLARITDTISQKADYSLRVEKQFDDETGTLYDRFNFMLSQIENREENLKISEYKFKQMSRSAFDTMVLVDNELKIQFWNEAGERVFNFTEAEILNKNLDVLFFRNSEYKQYKLEVFDFEADESIDYQDVAVYLTALTKEGKNFPVEVAFVKIRFNNKPAAVGTIRDISIRKRFEDELLFAKEKAEIADQLKSSFLSNMSHEIRTPMNSIIGFTELLHKPNITAEQRTKFLNFISSSGKSLLNLIDDIIDISKIEAKQLRINLSPTRINELLSEIYDSVSRTNRQQFSKKLKLKLNTNIDSEFCIITDPFRLKQVFDNLISNALKFTREGFIEFGYTEKDKETIEFYVRDTGVGIPEDQQKLIFDRFGQVKETLHINKTGTGLGLAISRKLTEMLGGKIRVESKVNEGSTFYFVLPKEEVKRKLKAPHKQNTLSESPDWHDRFFLIAEDEEINYSLLSEILSVTNVKIKWVKNGKEAVDIVDNQQFDLILMDVKMPIMSGYAATREIKKKHPQLPIIAQTAYAMSGEKDLSIQAGCDGYLSKPIKSKQLFEMINELI